MLINIVLYAPTAVLCSKMFLMWKKCSNLCYYFYNKFIESADVWLMNDVISQETYKDRSHNR